MNLRSQTTSSIAAMLLVLSLNATAADNVDPTIQALRALDNSIANQQLGQAESQLQTLQKAIPGDTRLEQAQREISAAYVKQGQAALNNANLAAASQALDKAQHAMPAGNAQTIALANSIQNSKEQQATAARAAQQAAAAKAAAEKAEQAYQQKQAAERKAAEAKQAEQAEAKPEAVTSKLIDPAAVSSTLALPMLDDKDNDALRRLLDQLAPEIVALNCKVKIEVRENKNYPWVASLLSARVKKIDPSFDLQLEHQIDPAKDPQLVLTPQS